MIQYCGLTVWTWLSLYVTASGLCFSFVNWLYERDYCHRCLLHRRVSAVLTWLGLFQRCVSIVRTWLTACTRRGASRSWCALTAWRLWRSVAETRSTMTPPARAPSELTLQSLITCRFTGKQNQIHTGVNLIFFLSNHPLTYCMSRYRETKHYMHWVEHNFLSNPASSLSLHVSSQKVDIQKVIYTGLMSFSQQPSNLLLHVSLQGNKTTCILGCVSFSERPPVSYCIYCYRETKQHIYWVEYHFLSGHPSLTACTVTGK